MHWKHPHHSWWLSACLLGLLISVWTGGFSIGLALMLLVIFAVGAVLISQGESDSESDPESEADASDLDPVEAD